jgi:dethiobiotin synthetase
VSPQGARLEGLFVTGTDTGVGKTFVASALCLALRRMGRPVVGFKPFETGCTPRPADADALEAAARSGLPLDLRCPFRYREAIAPAVASVRLKEPRRRRLAAALRLIRSGAAGRFAVVEGAGGLLAPLDGELTNLDLARELRLPVVLVARNALGTLNHTCLTLEVLRQHGLAPLAIILSGTAARDPSQKDNAAWIRRLGGVKTVLELPRCTLARASGQLGRWLAPGLQVG